MKKPHNPVLDKELGAMLYTCIICGTKTQGAPYGRWGDIGGTCGRSCEATKEAQPRDFGEPHEHSVLPGGSHSDDHDVSPSQS